MSIILAKGTQLNLSKSTNTTSFRIGLGWDLTEAKNLTGEFDLDVSICGLELDSNQGKSLAKDDSYFIFYNNTKSVCGGIIHSGDNKTGQGDGDDESLVVDFSKLNSKITELAIVVSIHDAMTRLQNFGMAKNSYIRVIDTTKNQEVCRYTLNDNYGEAISLHIGSLVRVGDSLEFRAVGEGYAQELSGLLQKFGYQV